MAYKNTDKIGVLDNSIDNNMNEYANLSFKLLDE